MPSERITLHRTNVDKTEVIEQYPKTIAGQVYDFENEKFLDATLNDFKEKTAGVTNAFMYNIHPDGVIGNSAALQAMVNDLRNKAIANNLDEIYTVEIPGGLYLLDAEIKLSPYIKLKPLSNVEFRITHNGTGFWIAPSNGDLQFEQTDILNFHKNKNSWNRGKWLDGSNGSITITSSFQRDDNNNTVAVELGRRDAVNNPYTPIGRYVLEQVNIYNVGTGFKINCVNNFIGTFKNCHIEGMKHAFHFNPIGGVDPIDAGENFVIDNCILAGARDAVVLVECSGVDILIEKTSIDFNVNPILKVTRSGVSIRLVNSYLEMIGLYGPQINDSLLYLCEGVVSAANSQRNSLIIDNTILFLNKPRTLINNAFHLNNQSVQLHLDIRGLELRYSGSRAPDPYITAHRFITKGENIIVYNNTIINTSLLRLATNRSQNILFNGDFSKSALVNLTATDSDLYWDNVFLQNTSVSIIEDADVFGGKCARIVSTSATNGTWIRNKKRFNVEAGKIFLLSPLVRTDVINSTMQLIYRISFYDKDNVLIMHSNYYEFFNPETSPQNIEEQWRVVRSWARIVAPVGAYDAEVRINVVDFPGSYFDIGDVHCEVIN